MLDAMVKHKVMALIFSSTAAVYGEPKSVSIEEVHLLNSINPYGKGKLMIEEIAAGYDKAIG